MNLPSFFIYNYLIELKYLNLLIKLKFKMIIKNSNKQETSKIIFYYLLKFFNSLKNSDIIQTCKTTAFVYKN